jgi:hypothetical protein
MRLTGVKVGDLVLVDDGAPFHAEVIDAPVKQRVQVRVLGRSQVRTVTARHVAAHWRKAKVTTREVVR